MGIVRGVVTMSGTFRVVVTAIMHSVALCLGLSQILCVLLSLVLIQVLSMVSLMLSNVFWCFHGYCPCMSMVLSCYVTDCSDLFLIK